MKSILTWDELEDQWKKAFAEVFFLHNETPSDDELAGLKATTILRLVGPGAPFPNMSFELDNLSGLSIIPDLKILIVTHHKISSLHLLKHYPNLNSLFVLNNKLKSLEGIENLLNLKKLYVQNNEIESLLPLSYLTNLKEIYINNNKIQSLEGLTIAHEEHLETFVCKPNDLLRQRELLRFESEIGVRAMSI